MGAEVEAVVVLPLDVADPDDHGRQFLGVDVSLDSVELLGDWCGQQSGKAVGGGEDADFLFEIEQLLSAT